MKAALTVVMAALTLATTPAFASPDVTIVRQGTALRAAFKAAYGEVKQHHMTLDKDGDFTLTPSALIHTRAGFFLVSAAYNESGCHACSSGLSVTAFADDHGRPGNIVGKLPFVSGGYGSETSATWKIDDRLTLYPALFIDSGWEGQGCMSNGFGVVELAPVPVVRADYVALTKNDMENDCCRIHIKGKLMPGVSDDHFAVRYRGWTWPAGRRRQPVSRTVAWKMKGDRFVADAPVIGDLTC